MKALFLGLSTVCWVGICLAAEPVYFIVGGPVGGPTNSFLLPLTNAADITKARMIAAAGNEYTFAFPGAEDPQPFVRIRTGGDGTNRDVLTSGQPLWSWHVDELLQWVSGGLFEVPYYYPWQVERDVVAGNFQDGTGVRFNGCNLLAELNPPFELYLQVQQPPQGNPAGIFYWTYTATNKVFSVEWTPSLNPPAWKSVSVSGPNPAVKVLNVFPLQAGLYRLRADLISSP